MSDWDSVARNLISTGEFDRPKFDGKKAQVRFAKDFDDESASTEGGRLRKVPALMNEGGKNELDLRKFMFEKEMEERKKEREFQAEERNKDREIQAQQIQMLQTTMTTLLSALVKKL
ncbi:hypothetical protein H310_08085 [Aphanomyces invadans]|uniref:Uncharacterized protein n=1 Tax=Aphanomyces invadans TaxID=157072 RepID=A0A024U195_9STRA|nr:hypothetical protein H310_08085 [Aphanomyces invadans]ETV99372.1 hypothetical protein H310_08085 [Aphanomyces invadans]|eukprot:XP_008871928.1 hypothetical protein H310_08085 [Aphanomyces invadans]